MPPIADMIPGFDLANIVGLFGKPGLPQAVLDKITAEQSLQSTRPRRSGSTQPPGSKRRPAMVLHSTGR